MGRRRRPRRGAFKTRWTDACLFARAGLSESVTSTAQYCLPLLIHDAMAPSSDVQTFRQVLLQSKHIVAITGAGLSAGSGITTWRGADGAWVKNDVSKLANPQAFKEDPLRVWQFYHGTREAVMRVEPNAAHLALAMLRVPSLRAMLAPLARFTLVTQNIDSLCSRAGAIVLQQQQSQSSDSVVLDAPLYEMHGRVLDALCTGCGAREHDLTSPLIIPFATNSGDSVPCSLDDLPHCKTCNELLRPGVVWFEEVPHHLREIWAAVDDADLCLVIGSSSTVYPAAAFAHEVSGHGGKVAIFNLSRTEGDEIADFLFLGPCEETLPLTMFNTSLSS